MKNWRKSLYGIFSLALALLVVAPSPGLNAVYAMCSDAPAKVMPCHAKSTSYSGHRASLQAACCCELGAVPESTDTAAPNLIAEPPKAQGNDLWHPVLSVTLASRATPSVERFRLDSSHRTSSAPLFVLNSSFLI